MGINLPVIWALIIGFGLMMYIIMDGFDLGIGILFPFIKDKHERDVMVNTVAPVWDGNETWLVLGGAGLLAAFPVAYAVILSALYIPLMLMLVGLIWRGVAFEFRFKADESHRPFWDKAFIWGSFLATFCQGAALGGLINGIHVENNAFAGGALDWLSPFSIFTGIALIIGYALLGSTWLVYKTEGALHAAMKVLAKRISLVLFAVIFILSIWTPMVHPAIAARWFTDYHFIYFAPVPLLVIFVTWLLCHLLGKETHAGPFVLSLFLVFLAYSGLIISLWPHIIPPDITLEMASSPPQSQGFALVGALVIIPIILVYTTWSYYVFRGKVKIGDGYH